MRGLLRKDFGMMWSICRMNLLIMVAYGVIGFVTGKSFFLYFPCFLAAMIPMSLLSGDEQCRWDSYAAALPCSAGELVGSKYLLGGAAQLSAVLLMLPGLVIRREALGMATLSEALCLAVLLLFVANLSNAVTLPVIFRFGVEKGRLGYFVLLGMGFGGIAIISRWAEEGKILRFEGAALTGVILVATVILNLGSYILSIRAYQRRWQQG